MALISSSIRASSRPLHAASACRASRAETPTLSPPVASLISASRSEASSRSQSASSSASAATGPACASRPTTSASRGAVPSPCRGQISATVSARSPTKS